MVPDLEAVIRLQDLDNRIAELKQEVSSLPKHIAAIEKALDGHHRKIEMDRAALLANQKERKNLESEIQSQEQKISKLKNQMLDAKTNEQYSAFRHEIEFCEKEIRRFEDRILDRMQESDPLEKNVRIAEAALAKEKQQVEKEKQAARERTAIDQKKLAELEAQRQALVKSITPQVYKTYNYVRQKRHGVAVAEAVEDRCTACHMALRPQFCQDLRRGDQILRCESCGRILYYTPPPVEVDELGPEAPAPEQSVETGR